MVDRTTPRNVDDIVSQFGDVPQDTGLSLPFQNDSNFNKAWELSSDDVIEMVEHILRGHKKKRDGSYDTTHEKEWRLMNELGIFRTITAMQAVLNKNTYLSNFDEIKTFELIRYFSIYYAEILAYYYKEFDLKVDYLDYIHELVTDTLAFAIQRQMGGGERSLRTQPENIQRVIRQDISGAGASGQPEKKRGLLGIGFAGL